MWEYKIAKITVTHTEEQFLDKFNQLGRMGWEFSCCCNIDLSEGPATLVIFKRPIGLKK